MGKSTMFQMLQRFYDYDDGNIDIGKISIPDRNVSNLRHQFGLVQQEPILFNRTIADNIRYGLIDQLEIHLDKDDLKQTYDEHSELEKLVPIEKVYEVAKQANIHKWVLEQPEKYDTMVKEGQISGGQKQRVAIARALIREPKILLLDEATSALDTESERLVMDSLERARVGRTSITIAHRLSTIKNVNQIYIIDNGQIVEHGTHDQLLESQGFYCK